MAREEFMIRPSSWLVRWLALTVFCASACAEMRETPSKETEYFAYGKTWRYYTVERYNKRWALNTPHGLIGEREDWDKLLYLVAPDGEKIAVHERIYALQKNGSYKRVECCRDVRSNPAVYNFGDALVLNFEQSKDKVTDCRVYPTGYPNDEEEPDPAKRRRYITLFGTFDQAERRFYVREFLPDFSTQEFHEKLGNRPNAKQTVEFFYSKRQPFICN